MEETDFLRTVLRELWTKDTPFGQQLQGEGVAIGSIRKYYSDERKKLESAYGGCRNCYGKGYSTQDAAIIGYPDFIGDKGFKRYEHRMIFCQCDRGKTLEREISYDQPNNR